MHRPRWRCPIEAVALAILALVALLGVAATVFTTAGPTIIVAGAVAYAGLTGLQVVGVDTLALLLFWYLVGEGLCWLFVKGAAEPTGTSRATPFLAVLAALAGGGAAAYLGVPDLHPALAGAAAAVAVAFTAELIHHRHLLKAALACTAGVVGQIGAWVMRPLTVAMLLYVLGWGVFVDPDTPGHMVQVSWQRPLDLTAEQQIEPPDTRWTSPRRTITADF